MENVDNLTCTVLGVVILVKKRAVDANFSLSSFLFNMSYGVSRVQHNVNLKLDFNLDVDSLARARGSHQEERLIVARE